MHVTLAWLHHEECFIHKLRAAKGHKTAVKGNSNNHSHKKIIKIELYVLNTWGGGEGGGGGGFPCTCSVDINMK